MYYTIWLLRGSYQQEEKDAYAKWFLENFMAGYNEENTLDGFWLNEIPFFLKLRDITLYTVFHKKFDQTACRNSPSCLRDSEHGLSGSPYRGSWPYRG